MTTTAREADLWTTPVRWSLAIGCALSVGNLYYVQPLLPQIAREFHVTEGTAGVAATLAQIGYAAGMLLIVPLGDICERRFLILASLVATLVALGLMAIAPTFLLLCVASALIGVATCTPQLIVPFAAALAPPEARARAVGFVMSGLLAGILVARSFAGLLGEAFGWRAVYFAGMGLTALLFAGLARTLPRSLPQARIPYLHLFGSIGRLIREEPVLRRGMAYGALLFGAFSAFWTTLGFHLQREFGLGPAAVGGYAVLGIAGVLAPSLVGRRLDKGGASTAAWVGMLLTGLSFVAFLVGAYGHAGLVAGVLILDVGTQTTHISNQSRIYGRRPEARSRMNTAYMTAYFLGGAAGSALGAAGWQAFGWAGVSAVGIALPTLGLILYAATEGRQRRSNLNEG